MLTHFLVLRVAMLQSRSLVLSYLGILGAALIWSTSFVVTKISLESFPPLTLALLRLVIATLLLGLIGVAVRQIKRPPLGHLLKMAATGFVGITLYFCFENFGLKFTSSSDGVLLISSFPVITILLEALLYRKRLSGKRLLGAAVAIFGVSLIMRNAVSTEGSQRLLGDVLLLGSGVAWALYNFITRSIVNKYSIFTLSFFQSLSAGLFFLPLALLERDQWVPPSSSAVKSLFYLGAICSVAAYLLYNFGLKRLEASAAVAILNAMPVFGVLFSVLILHESITALQILGGIIVLVGVTVSARGEKKLES